MRPISFIYIVSILFACHLTQGVVFAGSHMVATGFCVALIFLAGIPHGAIDHVLSVETMDTSLVRFYMAYVLTMLAYIVVWVVVPLVAASLFIIVSAYHFGEAQFKELAKSKPTTSLLSLVWGIAVLVSFVYFQYPVLEHQMNSADIWQATASLFDLMSSPYLVSASWLSLLVLLMSAVRVGLISLSAFFHEVFVFAIIVFSFIALDPFLSFTLFFVVLHSARVLRQEYEYLATSTGSLSIRRFVKMLLPLTAVSLVGLGAIFAINYWWFSLPIIYLVLIITSVVTLPHAFVMYKFYSAKGQQEQVCDSPEMWALDT